MDKQWSVGFAHSIAEQLLFAVPSGTSHAPDGLIRVPFTARSQEATEDIAAILTTLSSEKVQEVLDFADFIRANKLLAYSHPVPLSEKWAFAKLQEVRDFALFLRHRNGACKPTDENDAWSNEDQRDVTVAALSTWDERESEGQP